MDVETENPAKDLLRQSMSNLLSAPKFSDFNIEAGGRVFPCHKDILAVRSDVFKTMFEEQRDI